MNDDTDNTGKIDYRAIDLPQNDDYEKWSTAERRGYVYRALEHVGHPRGLNGAALGRKFGVNRSTIHNDLDILADYINNTSSARRDLITESVYQTAIWELQEAGEHLKAARVVDMWNSWLMERGKTERTADKTELAVTGNTETDAIRIFTTSDSPPENDEADAQHGSEITDAGGW